MNPNNTINFPFPYFQKDDLEHPEAQGSKFLEKVRNYSNFSGVLIERFVKNCFVDDEAKPILIGYINVARKALQRGSEKELDAKDWDNISGEELYKGLCDLVDYFNEVTTEEAEKRISRTLELWLTDPVAQLSKFPSLEIALERFACDIRQALDSHHYGYNQQLVRELAELNTSEETTEEKTTETKKKNSKKTDSKTGDDTTRRRYVEIKVELANLEISRMQLVAKLAPPMLRALLCDGNRTYDVHAVAKKLSRDKLIETVQTSLTQLYRLSAPVNGEYVKVGSNMGISFKDRGEGKRVVSFAPTKTSKRKSEVIRSPYLTRARGLGSVPSTAFSTHGAGVDEDDGSVDLQDDILDRSVIGEEEDGEAIDVNFVSTKDRHPKEKYQKDQYPKEKYNPEGDTSVAPNAGLYDTRNRLRNTFVGLLNGVAVWMVFDSGTKLPIVPRTFLEENRSHFVKATSRPVSTVLTGPGDTDDGLVVERVVTLSLKLYSRELREMLQKEVDFYVANTRMVLLPEDILVEMGRLRPYSAFYGDVLTSTVQQIWPSAFKPDFKFNQVQKLLNAGEAVQHLVDDQDLTHDPYGSFVESLRREHAALAQEVAGLRALMSGISGRSVQPSVGYVGLEKNFV